MTIYNSSMVRSSIVLTSDITDLSVPSGEDLTIKMGDNAGATSVDFNDSDNVTVFSIDSNGVASLSSSSNLSYETTATISYYVNVTTGNDTTGTGAIGAPFKTLQKAINSLPDVINHNCYIYLAAGNYSESNIELSKINTAISGSLPVQYLYITGTVTQLLAEQTAEGGSRTTITDTGAFAGVNYAGKFVELLAGPNFINTSLYPQYSNYYPIRSNTDDVLTLGCKMGSLLTAATHYRIVENATNIVGAGVNTDYGLINNSSDAIELHVRNINFSKAYYGILNNGYVWVQGCMFTYDTVGYSGVMGMGGSKTIVDGSYITGNWFNAGLALDQGITFYARQNYIYNGIDGLECDSGNYFFSYGNVIDTMSENGYKTVNSGIIKGSDNANTGTEISNCTGYAFYSVFGGKINDHMATGAGNGAIARLIGDSSVIYNSTKITAAATYTFDDACGTVTDRGTGNLFTLNYNILSDDYFQTLYGRINNVTTVNAATYDLLVTDDILHVTYTSTAAVTSLTLPTAQVVEGRVITIKDAGGMAGTNNITIDTEGAELIDGAATYVISSNYAAVNLYCNGTNWFVY